MRTESGRELAPAGRERVTAEGQRLLEMLLALDPFAEVHERIAEQPMPPDAPNVAARDGVGASDLDRHIRGQPRCELVVQLEGFREESARLLIGEPVHGLFAGLVQIDQSPVRDLRTRPVVRQQRVIRSQAGGVLPLVPFCRARMEPAPLRKCQETVRHFLSDGVTEHIS